MDKIHFPYRSSSHLVFLHVVAESGSWERYDLDVEYDTYISSEDAHKHVADGSVEFVGGNHVSTYAARTRGDQWLYLGQTVSLLDHRLVVRADSGIEGVSDLKEKVVAIRGNHPGLNTWLFLKQHGLDEDRGDVKLERIRGAATWETVRDGNADAALVNPPADLFAERAGLKVIAVDPLPMVWFTTMSSGRKFVDRPPGHRRALPQGRLPGHRLFQDPPAESPSRIIQEKVQDHDGDLDLEAATRLWESLSGDPDPETLRLVPGREQRVRAGQAQGPGSRAESSRCPCGTITTCEKSTTAGLSTACTGRDAGRRGTDHNCSPLASLLVNQGIGFEDSRPDQGGSLCGVSALALVVLLGLPAPVKTTSPESQLKVLGQASQSSGGVSTP